MLASALAFVSFRSAMPVGLTVLIATGCGPSKLHEAVRRDDVARVQELVAQHPMDVDVVSKRVTPLMEAAYRGNLQIATLLVKHGADVNAGREGDDATALHQAAIKGHAAMAEFLLSHGANVDARDTKGITPLISAAAFGSLDVARVLIAHGATADVVTPDGDTAVHHAFDEPILALCKLLVDAGAGVNRRRQNGIQPIHLAAREGNAEVMTLLVSAGADVNAQDDDGLTPLHMASLHRNEAAAYVLFVHGARPTLAEKHPVATAWATKYGAEYIRGRGEAVKAEKLCAAVGEMFRLLADAYLRAMQSEHGAARNRQHAAERARWMQHCQLRPGETALTCSLAHGAIFGTADTLTDLVFGEASNGQYADWQAASPELRAKRMEALQVAQSPCRAELHR